MRTLLFGFIFGLLAVVHSSPITNVTQIPDKVEDEILQAVTDGFLVDLQGLTTESTKKNTTVPVPEQTSTVSDEKVFEGSASGESADLFPPHVGEHFTTTTTAITTTTTTTTYPTSTTTAGEAQQTSTVSGVKDGDLFPPHEGEHITTTATTTTTTVAAAATATTTTTTTTTTSAASQPTSTVSGVKDFEGSASGDLFPPHDGEHFTTTPTTTTSAASQQTSTVLGVTDFEGSASGDLCPPHKGEHFTTTTTTAASPQTSTVSGEKAFEGSASGKSPDLFPLDEVHSTTPPTVAAPVVPRGSRMFGINKKAESEQGSEGNSTNKDAETDESPSSVSVKKDDKDVSLNNEPQKGITEMHKGHATPGWIIIVAFIVGLAALIMVCVAIATRDKWNGPKQAAPLETSANSTNQQKDQEMETFLPKENGKPSEYTVIPLDELPEKYSSD